MNETAQRSLETQFVETEIVCRRCQVKFQPPITRFVNAGTDPDARLAILLKSIHHAFCPQCKHKTFIDTTFEYYDPDQSLVVQIRPEWEFKAGGGEDWYLKRFEDLVMKYSDTEVRVDVVFGLDEMIHKYLGGDEAVAQAQVEWEQRKEVAADERQKRLQVATHQSEDSDEDDSGTTSA